MKKLFAVILAFTMLLSLAACGDKQGQTDKATGEIPEDELALYPQEQLEFMKKTAEELAASAVSEGETADAAAVLEFMENYRNRNVIFDDFRTVFTELPNMDAAIEILEKNGAEMPEPEEVFDTFAVSSEPMLRAYAIGLLAPGTEKFALEMSDEYAGKIASMLENEKSVEVAAAALSVMADCTAEFPELLETAENYKNSDNPALRYLAAACMGAAGDKEVLTLMNDENDGVRAEAVLYSGKAAGSSIIPELKSVLAEPDSGGLHGAAVKALQDLWYAAPDFKPIYREAYDVLLGYIESCNESNKLPDSAAFEVFEEKLSETWLQRAIWFDSSVLTAALEDTASDENCSGEYFENLQKAISILKATGTPLPGSCNLVWD